MYSSVHLDSYFITKLISTLNILRLMVDAPRVCSYFNQDSLPKPEPLLVSVMLFVILLMVYCFDLKECLYI